MGKSNSANKAAGQAAQAQAALAQQLVNQTAPVRTGLLTQAQGFLTGNRDVTSLPEYQAVRATLDPQFNRARDSIIGATPEGGALTSALSNLETDRARALTQASGQLSSDEINRALQLGTFGAAQGSQGLASAGAIQAQRAQAEAAQAL